MRATLLLSLLLFAGCSDPTPSAPPASATDTDPAIAPANAPAATADAAPALEHRPPPAPPTPAIPVAAGELGALVTAQDTLDSLRARHGADNVVEGSLPMGGGNEAPGWVLFAADDQRRVLVYLDSLDQPTELTTDGDRSVWSAQGARVGMPLPELQALNGGALAVMAFGSAQGGSVVDWRGGIFAGSGVTVRLCRPDGAIPPNYPMGQQPFASDDPRVATLVPRICLLGQQIGPTADR